MKDRKLTIAIIAVLVISILGLGIAFAAFSQTLTINGSAEVEASKWQVVFEGMTNTSTIDAPTTSGTAEEVTHPTIKNDATEISTYSVSLKTPGDSITYNFKIHNKGDYAADVSTLTISGVTNPTTAVSGSALVTDSSIATANANTLAVIEYKLYYTDNNNLVGQDDGKDCLEPGETENVSLRITFASVDSTDTSILPASNLTLDNLGVNILYNQCSNGSCAFDPSKGKTETNAPFANIDGAYYTYQSKSFKGTGVNNVIISENIISKEAYSNMPADKCSDNSTPQNGACPAGTTPVFSNSPARTAAAAYCTTCRLMTFEEALSWDSSAGNGYIDVPGAGPSNKRIAKYNGTEDTWWLEGASGIYTPYMVVMNGLIQYTGFSSPNGVRPAAEVSSTATMTGAGTSASPYVISQ